MLISRKNLRNNLLIDIHTRIDIRFRTANNLRVRKLTESLRIKLGARIGRHNGRVQDIHYDVDYDEC